MKALQSTSTFALLAFFFSLEWKLGRHRVSEQPHPLLVEVSPVSHAQELVNISGPQEVLV